MLFLCFVPHFSRLSFARGIFFCGEGGGAPFKSRAGTLAMLAEAVLDFLRQIPG
jgi:hypothetical protein